MELRKKQHDIFIEGRYIREFVPGGDNHHHGGFYQQDAKAQRYPKSPYL